MNVKVKDHSLNITLIRVSLKDEKELIHQFNDGFYNRFRDHVSEFYKTKNSNLYTPFHYYIFGNYDLAILTLIDNYSFSQKLFIPKDKKDIIYNYSYQNITGIIDDASNSLLKSFYKKHSFICISNYKLNNKFLVKYGLTFTQSITKKVINILNTLKKSISFDFIILHSFSWFEFTITFFLSDPHDLAAILSSIRDLKTKELNRSINTKFKIGSVEYDFANSDVFSDTISYFGIKYQSYNDFALRATAQSQLNLRTEIEWKIKPGHLDSFVSLAKSNSEIENYFEINTPLSILGKTDYVFTEKTPDSFNNNVSIHKFLKSDNEVYRHIKSINTKVYLNSSSVPTTSIRHSKNKGFKDSIIVNIDLNAIDQMLKSFNLSRQTRDMTLKILQMYILGIKDEILSIYFFDFYFYVQNFIKLIHDYNKHRLSYITLIQTNVANKQLVIESFENKLHKWIKYLDEGIKLRTLNSYHYEDITELTLDFNSSVQQLISMYNTLANHFLQTFVDTGDMSQSPGLLVLLNYKSTKSSHNVILYNVYDLIYPEFVFFSIVKEVFNYLPSYYPNIKTGLSKIEQEIDELFQSGKDFYAYLELLNSMNLIQVNYLFNDVMRFFITCNLEPDLFIYWTWCSSLKNSSVYDAGTLSEDNFIFNLFRICFVLKLYDYDPSTLMYCPVSELEDLWHSHYKKINSEVDALFENPDFLKIVVRPIKNLAVTTLEKSYSKVYNNIEPPSAAGKLGRLLKYVDVLEPHNNDFRNIKNRIASLDKKDSDSSSLHAVIENKIFQYLSSVMQKNHTQKFGYLNYLHRNWESGTPMRNFNDFTDDSSYYKIDQTGGVFFHNQTSAQEYFKFRNQQLISFWDISMKLKSKLTIDKIYE